MVCRRPFRRLIRCSGTRKMCMDLLFILLFIIALSVVVSHLHASLPVRHVSNGMTAIDDEIRPVDRFANNDYKESQQKNEPNFIVNDNQVKDSFKGKFLDDGIGNKREKKYINDVPYPMLSSEGNFIPIQRIVHLDLKGGAYRPYFFDEIFQLLKNLGATGVLIEWEDMFPYKGRLAAAKNGNAYSMEDVHRILSSARNHGLEIIPLLQTFGHLEWILKLEDFSHLREAAAYPQVICFASEEAMDLIKEMIDEVFAVHFQYGLNYFHMGADEVFQIGYCNSSLKVLQREGSKEKAMLWHMARVARYIRSKKNISVMAWHDMVVQASEEDILFYKMPDLIEPVLWSYAEQLDQYLSPSTWFNLRPFKKVWGSSVYKGADGPMQFHSNPIHYIRNNEAWIEQMTNNYREFEYLQGMVLSGWSRYDHMAILCELFPVAVPSLAMSLETLIRGRKLDGEYSYTMNLLKCLPPVRPGFVEGCNFPGKRVYELINEFNNQHEQWQHYLRNDFELNGWLSNVAVKYRSSSPMYLEKIVHFIEFYLITLEKLETDLRDELGKIYFNDTVDEFILTYMEEDLNTLRQRYKAAMDMIKQRHFPKRPFIELVSSLPLRYSDNGINSKNDKNVFVDRA
uniref:beta-N-acetylhexosaminidase n=1 Tax=Syphacia muris TaxID=451379 RepID=A0A0N5A9J8_9BILA